MALFRKAAENQGNARTTRKIKLLEEKMYAETWRELSFYNELW